MSEHPILFSGEMVRALLAGRKTQTRRIITSLSGHREFVTADHTLHSAQELLSAKGNAWIADACGSPYGKPGDYLWVRETWTHNVRGELLYRADVPEGEESKGRGWKPSIFMRRAASRITLEVVAVRAERVQDITPRDIMAEGVTVQGGSLAPVDHWIAAWAELWDRINGKRAPWASNPWVWRVAFQRVSP